MSAAATADVAIVGGGIVGAACARACALDKLKVILIEAGDLASGATAAGMGHLVAMDDSEAQFALTAYSVKLWRELRPELPAGVEWDPCGTLWVAANEDELTGARARQQFYQARGVHAEMLDATALREAEPELREGLAGALLVPGDAVIYAPCAAHWLAMQARERGAWIRQSVEATAVTPGLVKLNDGSTVSAGAVVVAAGVESAALLAGLAVRPRKGHLAITDRYPGFVRHQLVELGYLASAHGHDAESVAFNVQPRSTQQVLIGSSRQYDTKARDVEPAILARMLRRACEFLPRLGELSVIRAWTGFRPATPDSLPIVGLVNGVWAATGHEGLGITTALGTARMLADMLLGRATAIPAAPYSPARFAA